MSAVPGSLMTTVLLYIATVILWGSTWIMMKYQLGDVAPAASLTYRYLAAGTLVLIGAALSGRRVRLRLSEHLRCMAQGVCLFSVNYWLTYLAAAHITTGIISVFFAGVAAVTMIMSAVLAWRLPPSRALIGALLGIAGIALVFWPEVAKVRLDGPEVQGGLLIMISVTLFSAGGLIGARSMATGMPRFGTIGWAMIYGAALMAVITVLRGDGFGWTWRPSYVWSLAGLTLIGSVAVFVLYFTVIERIGAEKASYATVLFPLVALGVSTAFEDYRWPLLALLGAPLALIGNALVLAARGSPAPAQGPPAKAEAAERTVNVVNRPKEGTGIADDPGQNPGFPGDR